MRAQNLTISVPGNKCNKNCPYCVSKITGSVNYNEKLFTRNISKVINYAKTAQVNSVLFTSKGEPTLNFCSLLNLIDRFKDFPTELQTNGLMGLENVHSFINDLYAVELNILALSFDNWSDFDYFNKLTRVANDAGIIVRATLNITNSLKNYILKDDASLVDGALNCMIYLCKKNYISQLSFRKITIPNNCKRTAQVKWIEENVDQNLYDIIKNEVLTHKNAKRIRELPFGTSIYDIDGISVATFDYCIQDSHNIDDIRSLIYLEDGHLYTAWNSKASILF